MLPGVTVTATSTELLTPVVNVTDETGLYRLNNLPPGTYVVTAELAGFATYRREGILVRAGQTFNVDIQLGLSTLQETITVSGDSPMIETSKPTTSITLDRELIRAAPISSRRVFSDALDLAPGISSRNVDDGVGRRSYYFKGAVIFSHVFTLEGAPAGSFLDSSAHSIGFGGDTIQDTELKLSGVDAASPTGTGVVMNILAPRGGNQFKGSAIYDYQTVKWNSDNTKSGAAPGGLPTAQSVKQADLSIGWTAHAGQGLVLHVVPRRAGLTNGISRSAFNVANINALVPNFEPFDNFHGQQPAVREGHGAAHSQARGGRLLPERPLEVQQQPRARQHPVPVQLHRRRPRARPRQLGLVELAHDVVRRTTTTTSAAMTRTRTRASTCTGPQIMIHQDSFLNAGRQDGTGALVRLNTPDSIALSDSRMTVIRGDLTYFKTGWGGGHEFRAGIWAAPSMVRETTHRIHQQRVRAAGGSLHRSGQLRGRHDAVPPALPHAAHRADDSRVRPRHRLLRAGLVDADRAADGERAACAPTSSSATTSCSTSTA